MCFIKRKKILENEKNNISTVIKFFILSVFIGCEGNEPTKEDILLTDKELIIGT